MIYKVLFVCKGNICRSPLAQAIVHKKAVSAGLELVSDSVGTGGWHNGDPPDARAIVAARISGYDLLSQISRKIVSNDFQEFDLVVAMDETIRVDLENIYPEGATVPVVLMSSFGAPDGPRDVPDPYYTGKFSPVIQQLEACADGLVAQLLSGEIVKVG